MNEDWKVKAIKKIIEERLVKKGIPVAEFYEKVDLLCKGISPRTDKWKVAWKVL